MPVIYLDILLAINLAVDYLVLFGTARLGGLRFERIKGLFAAAVGAVYSLIVIFNLPKAVTVLTKFAVSCLMIFIAFGKRKPKGFIRNLAIFYICGFVFSGFMMLINSFAHADSFFIKNGVVYFELSAMEIVISGTAAFAVTEILRRLFRHGEPEGCSMVRIFYNGKVSVLKGFVDTGNNLSEPFGGTPVAVINTGTAEKLLPENMLDSVQKGDLSTGFGLRFVPAETVSGTVLMPAFKPEKVEIINENGEYEAEEIMLAVSEFSPENTVIMGKNLILREKGKAFSEV